MDTGRCLSRWGQGQGKGLGRERLEFSGIMRSGSVSPITPQILPLASTHHQLMVSCLPFLSHTCPFLCALSSPSKVPSSSLCVSFLSGSESILGLAKAKISYMPIKPLCRIFLLEKNALCSTIHPVQHPEKAQAHTPLEQTRLSFDLPSPTLTVKVIGLR